MPAATSELTGHLAFAAAVGDTGATELARQFHSGALRVLRPHYARDDGGRRAVVTVVNPGGGYLGADDYLVEAECGAGAEVLVTTQSATKVYRTPQGAARQRQRFELAAGAVLEVVPDQLIAYRGASYVQDTRVALADASAHFFSAEIVTPGWAPDGTLFQYDDVRLRTAVEIGGVPLLIDNLALRPRRTELAALGWLEGKTHSASVVIAGDGVDEDLLQAVRGLGDREDLVAGSSLLEGPGLVVRALAAGTEPLTDFAEAVGAAARAARARTAGPARRWNLRKY